MNEAYILYCVTIIIISSFKMFNKNGFNILRSIRSYNDYYIKDSIVIPIIHFIYSIISSLFFYLLGNNLRFIKIFDLIYTNLTKKQNTYFGIIIYSLEIFMYFLLCFCYMYIFTDILGIFSNIQNGDSSSKEIKSTILVIIVIMLLLILHGLLTNYILKNYQNKPKVLVSKLISLIKNLIVFIVVIYTIIRIIQYKFENSVIEDSTNYKNIVDFYENMKIADIYNDIIVKLQKLTPLKVILKNHILFTVLLQSMLTIFVNIGYMNGYNMNNMMIKNQIFLNVILLISNSLFNIQ